MERSNQMFGLEEKIQGKNRLTTAFRVNVPAICVRRGGDVRLGRMPPNVGIFTDYVGAYGRRVLQGVVRYANTHTDWSLTMLRMWAFAAIPPLDQIPVDGIITSIYPEELRRRVQGEGVPTVIVSSALRGHGLPSVQMDSGEVAKVGARFFLERGFKHFAFCGWPHVPFSRDRAAAFVAEIGAAGFACFEAPSEGPELEAMLERAPKPLAIMTANDAVASEVMAVCAARHIPVPESVAVLGVDNDDLIVTITKPMLASIDMPAQLVGFEAAAMLDGMFRGAAVGTEPKLVRPGGVVLRGSADSFAIDDVDVAEALRFIRVNAANAIRVQDILGKVALSRRTLERRFLAKVGRTPLEEIHRVHIERARQLLIETDLSIPEVAASAGFGDDTRFNFLFRRAVGTTPSGYRKQFRHSGRVG